MKLSEIVVLKEDATIPQLHQHIRQGFPDTKKRQHATNEVSVTKLQYTPIIQQDTLFVDSTTSSSNGNAHKQALEIQNVNFQPVNSGSNVKIKDSSNVEHAVTPAKLNTSNVSVFCDCEDYQMRFAAFNIQNNCHLGPPPARYVRKTTTRPPVNPLQVPGFCKHLICITQELQRLKILQ